MTPWPCCTWPGWRRRGRPSWPPWAPCTGTWARTRGPGTRCGCWNAPAWTGGRWRWGYAHGIHGDDAVVNSGLPEPRGQVADVSAPEQILRLGRERPGELTLLAVGPLTKLAIALLLEPELPARVRRVVIMGGALDHPGNITSH